MRGRIGQPIITSPPQRRLPAQQQVISQAKYIQDITEQKSTIILMGIEIQRLHQILIDKSKEDVADEVTELRLQITSLESEIRMLKGKNSQLQLDLQNRDVQLQSVKTMMEQQSQVRMSSQQRVSQLYQTPTALKNILNSPIKQSPPAITSDDLYQKLVNHLDQLQGKYHISSSNVERSSPNNRHGQQSIAIILKQVQCLEQMVKVKDQELNNLGLKSRLHATRVQDGRQSARLGMSRARSPHTPVISFVPQTTRLYSPIQLDESFNLQQATSERKGLQDPNQPLQTISEVIVNELPHQDDVEDRRNRIPSSVQQNQQLQDALPEPQRQEDSNTIENLRKHLEDAFQEIQRLKKQKQESINRSLTPEKHVQELRNDLLRFRRENQQLSKDIAAITKELEEAKQQLQKQEPEDTQNLKQENKDLLSRIQMKQNVLEDSIRLNQQLDEENKQLQKKINQALQEPQNQSQQQIQQLQQTINELRKQLESRPQQNPELKAQVEFLKKENIKQSVKNDQLQNQVRTLKDELNSANQNIKADNQLKRLEDENSDLKVENKQLKKEITEQPDNSFQKDLKNLQNENNSLKIQLEKISDQARRGDLELSLSQSAILPRSPQRVVELERENEELRNELKQVSDQKVNLERIIHNTMIQSTPDKAESKLIEQLQESRAALEQQLSAATKQNNSLKHQVDSLQQENEKLRRKYTEQILTTQTTPQYQTTPREKFPIQFKQSEKTPEQKPPQEEGHKRQPTQPQLVQVLGSPSAPSFSRPSVQKQQQIESLQMALNTNDQLINQLQKDKTDMLEQLKSKSEELQKAQRELQQSKFTGQDNEKQISQLKNEKDNLLNDLKRKNEELARQQNTLNNAQNNNQLLKQELASIKQEIDQKSQADENLKNQLQNKNQAVVEQQQAIQKKENEIQDNKVIMIQLTADKTRLEQTANLYRQQLEDQFQLQQTESSNLKEQIQQLKKQNQEAEQSNQNKEQQSNKQIKDLTEMNQVRNEQQQEFFKSQLQSKDKQIQQLQDKIGTLQSNEGIKEGEKEFRQQLEELQKDNQKLLNEIQIQENNNKQEQFKQESDQQQLKQEIDQVQSQLKTAKSQAIDQQVQIESLKNKNIQLEIQSIKLIDIDSLKEQLQKLQEDNLELHKQIYQQEQLASNLKIQKNQNEQELQQCKANLLQQQNNELNTQKLIQFQKENFNERIALLQQELQEQIDFNNLMKIQLDQKEEEVRSAIQQQYILTQEKIKMNQILNEQRNDYNGLKQIVSGLELNLEQQTQQNIQLAQHHSQNLQVQQSQFSQARQAQDMEVETLMDRIQNLEDMLNQKPLTDVELKFKEMENELVQLYHNIRVKSDQIRKLQENEQVLKQQLKLTDLEQSLLQQENSRLSRQKPDQESTSVPFTSPQSPRTKEQVDSVISNAVNERTQSLEKEIQYWKDQYSNLQTIQPEQRAAETIKQYEQLLAKKEQQIMEALNQSFQLQVEAKLLREQTSPNANTKLIDKIKEQDQQNMQLKLEIVRLQDMVAQQVYEQPLKGTQTTPSRTLEKQQLKEDLQKQDQRLQAIQDELDQWKNRCFELESKSSELMPKTKLEQDQIKIKSLESSIDFLKSQLSQKDKTIQEALSIPKEQLKETDMLIKLQAQLQSTQEKLLSTQQQLHSTQNNLQNAYSENLSLISGQTNQLDKINNDNKKNERLLLDQLDDKNQNVIQLLNENKALKIVLETIEKGEDIPQKQLQTYKNIQNEFLDKSIQSKQQQINELSQEQEKLANDVREMRQLQANEDNAQVKYLKKLNECQMQIGMLKTDCDQKKKQLEQLETQTQDYNQMRLENERNKVLMKNLEEQVNRAEVELANQKQFISDWEQSLRTGEDSQVVRLTYTEKRADQLKQDLEQKLEYISQLEAQVRLLKQKQVESGQRIDEKQQKPSQQSVDETSQQQMLLLNYRQEIQRLQQLLSQPPSIQQASYGSQDEIKLIQQELDKLLIQNEQLSNEVERWKQRYQDTQKAVQGDDASPLIIQQLEVERENLINQLNYLKSTTVEKDVVQSKDKVIEDQNQQIQLIQGQMQYLQTCYDNSNLEINKLIQNNSDNLQNMKSQHDRSIHNLELQIKVLSTQVGSKEKGALKESEEAQLTQLIDQVQLQKQIQDQQAQIAQLEAEVTQQKLQNTQTQQQLHTIQRSSQYSQPRSSQPAQPPRTSQIQTQPSQLPPRPGKQSQSPQIRSSQFARQTREQDEIEQLKQSEQVLQDQIEHLQDVVSTYQQEIDIWRDRFGQLQLQLTQKEQLVEQGKPEDLTQEQLLTKIQDLEINKSYLNNQIESQEKQLTLKEKQLQAVSQDLFRLQQQEANQPARYSEPGRRESGKKEQVTIQDKQTEQLLKDYENQLTIIRLQNAELENQVKALQKENLKLLQKDQEKLMHFSQQSKILRQKLDLAEQEANEWRSQYEQAVTKATQNQQPQDQSEQMEQEQLLEQEEEKLKINQLKSKNEKLNQLLSETMKQLEKKQQAQIEQEEETINLKEQVNKLSRDIRRLEGSTLERESRKQSEVRRRSTTRRESDKPRQIQTERPEQQVNDLQQQLDERDEDIQQLNLELLRARAAIEITGDERYKLVESQKQDLVKQLVYKDQLIEQVQQDNKKLQILANNQDSTQTEDETRINIMKLLQKIEQLEQQLKQQTQENLELLQAHTIHLQTQRERFRQIEDANQLYVNKILQDQQILEKEQTYFKDKYMQIVQEKEEPERPQQVTDTDSQYKIQQLQLNVKDLEELLQSKDKALRDWKDQVSISQVQEKLSSSRLVELTHQQQLAQQTIFQNKIQFDQLQQQLETEQRKQGSSQFFEKYSQGQDLNIEGGQVGLLQQELETWKQKFDDLNKHYGLGVELSPDDHTKLLKEQIDFLSQELKKKDHTIQTIQSSGYVSTAGQDELVNGLKAEVKNLQNLLVEQSQRQTKGQLGQQSRQEATYLKEQDQDDIKLDQYKGLLDEFQQQLVQGNLKIQQLQEQLHQQIQELPQASREEHSRQQIIKDSQNEAKIWREKYNKLLDRQIPDKQVSLEFQSQIDRLTSSNQEKTMQIDQLLNGILQLREQLKQSEVTQNAIKKQYLSYQEQITQLKLENSDLDEKLNQLREQKESFDQNQQTLFELKQAQQGNENLLDQLDFTKKILKQQEDVSTQAQTQCQTLQSQLNASNAQNDALQKDNLELKLNGQKAAIQHQNDLQNVRNELVAKTQESVNEINKKLSEGQEEIMNQSKKYLELQKDFLDLQERLTKSQINNHDLEEKLSKLTFQVEQETLQKQQQSLLEQQPIQTEKLSTGQVQLEQTEVQIQIRQLQADKDYLNQLVNQLQLEVEAHETTSRSQQQTISGLKEQIQGLQTQLNSLTQENIAMSQQLGDNKDQLNLQVAKIEERYSKQSQAKDQELLQRTSDKFSELQKPRGSQDTQSTEAPRSSEQQATIDQYTQSIQELQNLLSNKDKDLNLTKKQLESSNQQCSVLNQQIEIKDQELIQANQKFNQLQKEKVSSLKEQSASEPLENVPQDVQIENLPYLGKQQLEAQLSLLQSDLENWKMKYNDVQNKLDKVQKQNLDIPIDDVKQLQDEVAILKQELDKKSFQLEYNQNELRQISPQKSQVQEQYVQGLKQEIENIQTSLQEQGSQQQRSIGKLQPQEEAQQSPELQQQLKLLSEQLKIQIQANLELSQKHTQNLVVQNKRISEMQNSFQLQLATEQQNVKSLENELDKCKLICFQLQSALVPQTGQQTGTERLGQAIVELQKLIIEKDLQLKELKQSLAQSQQFERNQTYRTSDLVAQLQMSQQETIVTKLRCDQLIQELKELKNEQKRVGESEHLDSEDLQSQLQKEQAGRQLLESQLSLVQSLLTSSQQRCLQLDSELEKIEVQGSQLTNDEQLRLLKDRISFLQSELGIKSNQLIQSEAQIRQVLSYQPIQQEPMQVPSINTQEEYIQGLKKQVADLQNLLLEQGLQERQSQRNEQMVKETIGDNQQLVQLQREEYIKQIEYKNKQIVFYQQENSNLEKLVQQKQAGEEQGEQANTQNLDEQDRRISEIQRQLASEQQNVKSLENELYQCKFKCLQLESALGPQTVQQTGPDRYGMELQKLIIEKDQQLKELKQSLAQSQDSERNQTYRTSDLVAQLQMSQQETIVTKLRCDQLIQELKELKNEQSRVRGSEHLDSEDLYGELQKEQAGRQVLESQLSLVQSLLTQSQQRCLQLQSDLEKIQVQGSQLTNDEQLRLLKDRISFLQSEVGIKSNQLIQSEAQIRQVLSYQPIQQEPRQVTSINTQEEYIQGLKKQVADLQNLLLEQGLQERQSQRNEQMVKETIGDNQQLFQLQREEYIKQIEYKNKQIVFYQQENSNLQKQVQQKQAGEDQREQANTQNVDEQDRRISEMQRQLASEQQNVKSLENELYQCKFKCLQLESALGPQTVQQTGPDRFGMELQKLIIEKDQQLKELKQSLEQSKESERNQTYRTSDLVAQLQMSQQETIVTKLRCDQLIQDLKHLQDEQKRVGGSENLDSEALQRELQKEQAGRQVLESQLNLVQSLLTSSQQRCLQLESDLEKLEVQGSQLTNDEQQRLLKDKISFLQSELGIKSNQLIQSEAQIRQVLSYQPIQQEPRQATSINTQEESIQELKKQVADLQNLLLESGSQERLSQRREHVVKQTIGDNQQLVQLQREEYIKQIEYKNKQIVFYQQENSNLQKLVQQKQSDEEQGEQANTQNVDEQDRRISEMQRQLASEQYNVKSLENELYQCKFKCLQLESALGPQTEQQTGPDRFGMELQKLIIEKDQQLKELKQTLEQSQDSERNQTYRTSDLVAQLQMSQQETIVTKLRCDQLIQDLKHLEDEQKRVGGSEQLDSEALQRELQKEQAGRQVLKSQLSLFQTLLTSSQQRCLQLESDLEKIEVQGSQLTNDEQQRLLKDKISFLQSELGIKSNQLIQSEAQIRQVLSYQPIQQEPRQATSINTQEETIQALKKQVADLQNLLLEQGSQERLSQRSEQMVKETIGDNQQLVYLQREEYIKQIEYKTRQIVFYQQENQNLQKLVQQKYTGEEQGEEVSIQRLLEQIESLQEQLQVQISVNLDLSQRNTQNIVSQNARLSEIQNSFKLQLATEQKNVEALEKELDYFKNNYLQLQQEQQINPIQSEEPNGQDHLRQNISELQKLLIDKDKQLTQSRQTLTLSQASESIHRQKVVDLTMQLQLAQQETLETKIRCDQLKQDQDTEMRRQRGSEQLQQHIQSQSKEALKGLDDKSFLESQLSFLQSQLSLSQQRCLQLENDLDKIQSKGSGMTDEEQERLFKDQVASLKSELDLKSNHLLESQIQLRQVQSYQQQPRQAVSIAPQNEYIKGLQGQVADLQVLLQQQNIPKETPQEQTPIQQENVHRDLQLKQQETIIGQLQEQLISTDLKNQQLKEQLAQPLEKQLTTKTLQCPQCPQHVEMIKNLEKELKEWRDKYNTLLESQMTDQQVTSEFQTQLDQLQRLNEEKKNQIDQLYNGNVKLRDQLRTSELSLNGVKQQYLAYQEDLTKQRLENINLKNEIDNLKQQSETRQLELQLEVSNNRENLENVTKQFANEKNTLKDQFKQQPDDFENQIQSLKNSITKLTQTNQDLQSENSDQQFKINDLELQLKQLNGHPSQVSVENLQKEKQYPIDQGVQLENSQQENKALIQKLEQQIIGLREKDDQIQQQIKQIDILESKLREADDLGDTVEGLKKQLLQSVDEIQYLKDRTKKVPDQPLQGFEQQQSLQDLPSVIQNLQNQLKDKVYKYLLNFLHQDTQMEESMQSIQQIVNDQIRNELTQIRKQEANERQGYQSRIANLENKLREQPVERTTELTQTYEKAMFDLKKNHQSEVEHIVSEYEKKLVENNKLITQITQQPTSTDWRQRVIRLEIQRQQELESMRGHLDQLRRSQVNSSEIEFNAERKAYENVIQQLKNQIMEVIEENERLRQQHPVQKDQPRQQLYDYSQESEVRQLRESNDLLNMRNMDLEEELLHNQDERTQLEIKIQQLNAIIDRLQDSLHRAQQLIEQRRRERDDIMHSFDQLRREQETFQLRSPMQRDPRGSASRVERLSADRYSASRERQAFYSPNYRGYQPHFLSASRQPYGEQILQESQQRSQQFEKENSAQKNQELILKIQELEDVKNKYKQALNNIYNLEAKVIDKLQNQEVIIE